MGIFSTPSPCEADVEKATDEKNTSENWGLIMEVCDRAGKSSQESKDYIKAILKRINNTDPHIAIQAVTLLDACVKNCGKTFHIELASRDFENEYVKLLKKCHPQVNQKLRESLKKWSDGEFKSDPQLTLIPTLYSKLKNSGTDFNFEEQPKRSITLSKDPNVVQTQDEEDQIAKAIELSLKETSSSPRNTSTITTSLYPTTAMAAAAAAAPPLTGKDQRKVRALYDFEAAEDNELTFSSGEIIFILDDSDPNWWKGSNQRGEGLFPASFVSSDLTCDLDQLMQEKKKKLQELDESLEKQCDDLDEPENIEIDEVKIDRLLHLLHEADPTNPEQDTKEMLGLEKEVNSMGGLIDKELERVDRKHAQLTQLSSDLVEALSLYHTLMREPQFPTLPANKNPVYYPTSQYPTMMYNGNLHQQHPPQNMGGRPSLMQFNTLPHDTKQMMPPQQAMSMPPQNHYTLPPQGLPPGHMPSGAPQMSAPPPNMPMHGQMPPMPQDEHRLPMSAPHNMSMQGPPPQMNQDEQRLPFPPPQGFNTMNFQRPHLHQPILQSGPQAGNFSMPPVSNTHIM